MTGASALRPVLTSVALIASLSAAHQGAPVCQTSIVAPGRATDSLASSLESAAESENPMRPFRSDIALAAQRVAAVGRGAPLVGDAFLRTRSSRRSSSPQRKAGPLGRLQRCGQR